MSDGGGLKGISSRGLGQGVIGLAFAVLGAAGAQAQDYALESGAIGVDQVARGEEAYTQSCAACHGTDLRATDSQAVDLTGPIFDFAWVDHSVGERVETIASSMPIQDPGSLSDEAYRDITAYILAFNGVEPSEDEVLPEDLEALSEIMIVAP